MIEKSNLCAKINSELIKEEITHRKNNGTEFPAEISAGLVEFEDKKYILAFDRGLSECNQAEVALRVIGEN